MNTKDITGQETTISTTDAEARRAPAACSVLIDRDHLIAVAEEARNCCGAWEGRARLIGNCRADDLFSIFSHFIAQNG